MKRFDFNNLSLRDEFDYILNNPLYYQCPAIVMGIKSIPCNFMSDLIADMIGSITRYISESIDTCFFCGAYKGDNCAVKHKIERAKKNKENVTIEEILRYRDNALGISDNKNILEGSKMKFQIRIAGNDVLCELPDDRWGELLDKLQELQFINECAYRKDECDKVVCEGIEYHFKHIKVIT